MALNGGSILTGSALLINYLEIWSLCVTRLMDVISEVCRSMTDFAVLMSRDCDWVGNQANNSDSVLSDSRDHRILQAPLNGDCVEVARTLFHLGDGSKPEVLQRDLVDYGVHHGKTEPV